MIGTKFGSDWNMKSHTVHAKYTIDWSISSIMINSALRYIYLTILHFKVLPEGDINHLSLYFGCAEIPKLYVFGNHG